MARSFKLQASGYPDQAASMGREAASRKQLDKALALGYNGIMKKGNLLTFKVNDHIFQMTDTVNDVGCPDKAMVAANDYFTKVDVDMPERAWFGPSEGSPENTWIWQLGNFFY